MNKLLVIDNYDSFTYNLVQLFKSFSLDIEVFRNDAITIKEVQEFSPDYILISPGPKTPEDSGISKSLIREFYKAVPILGVCLGMQCINEVFNGETIRALEPVHGKKTDLYHNGKGLYQGLPSPFKVARYHSLVIKRKSKELVETSRTSDGIIMGIQHVTYPLFGVQFHPESFMTEYGREIAVHFLQSERANG